MQVPGHHPIQEIIAKKLFNISTVDHLEALRMISRCARAVTDEFIKIEEENKELRELRDKGFEDLLKELATIKDQKEEELENGGCRMTILMEHPVFQLMALHLGKILNMVKSYVEVGMYNKQVGHITVTVQKEEMPTPGAKVSSYRQALARLRERLQEAESSATLEHASVTLNMAVKMLEEEWAKIPHEEDYRADENNDRGPVPVEGADAGECSELPGGDGSRDS